jgi:putative transposase
MAIWRGGRTTELLVHSDPGSRYTSERYQAPLSKFGITCSMSRRGDVWDNSAMESFISTLKTERASRSKYRTRTQARAAEFDYVEGLYNIRRRHPTIGYVSPAEFQSMAATIEAWCLGSRGTPSRLL